MSRQSQSEFSLIERFFADVGRRDDVCVGIGDDGAVVDAPADKQLVLVVDTLLEGIHFPRAFDPFSIGYRALAVNLSDIAAMGAAPAWMTLSLSIPTFNESWLQEFANGLSQLAQQHNVALVGGDTVRGPLTVTIQVVGTVTPGKKMLRSGANHGDGVFVTGHVGSAAGALRTMQSEVTGLPESWFAKPIPRVAFGQALVDVGSACIDVSDGLLADAEHIARASGVAIEVHLERLPMAPELLSTYGLETARDLALSGGDDYELCFTAPQAQVDKIHKLSKDLKVPVTQIGEVVEGETVKCYLDGNRVYPAHSGYDHFAKDTRSS